MPSMMFRLIFYGFLLKMSSEAKVGPAPIKDPLRRAKIVGIIGAVANWSIPIAAIVNISRGVDAGTINGNLTLALIVYSSLFLRWSVAIRPINPPLFACHVVNLGAQITQYYRYFTHQTKPEEKKN